ncbi:MAG: Bifunctional protein GlmU [Bacteroidota bacterium]|jgi:serine O-acetyltransferase
MAKEYILTDYKRCGIHKISIGVLFDIFILKPNPGLKYMTIFRLVQHYRRRNRLLFYFYFLWLRRLKVKYGFDISYRTQIGKGFYIGHFGNVVIHGDSVIGDNCNISQGITIGVSNYGKKMGVPTIGNEVFIGPNAGVFGKITVGNKVTIGANSVVTEDIPEGKTVLPTAAIIIDKDLSDYYIQSKIN